MSFSSTKSTDKIITNETKNLKFIKFSKILRRINPTNIEGIHIIKNFLNSLYVLFFKDLFENFIIIKFAKLVDIEIGNNKGYLNNIGKRIKALSIKKGLFIRPLGNVIYLLPPLCITDNQLEKSYRIIFEILSDL